MSFVLLSFFSFFFLRYAIIFARSINFYNNIDYPYESTGLETHRRIYEIVPILLQ